MDRIQINANHILMTLLLLALGLPPFFRGLYFDWDRVAFVVAVVVLTALTWSFHRRATTPGSIIGSKSNEGVFVTHVPMDLLLLGLAAIYALSVLGYADKHDAVISALFYGGLFLVYWLVWRLADTTNRLTVILEALLFAAASAAVFSLLVGSGLIEAHSVVKGGRLFGPLQYPNAFASYLMAGVLIGLGLWAAHSNTGAGDKTPQEKVTDVKTHLYAAAGYALLTAFILTLSRGALLVLPLGLLALLLVTPKGSRALMFGRMLVISVPAVASAQLLAPMLREPATIYLGIFLMGAAAATALNCILILFFRLSDRTRTIMAVTGFLLVATVGSFILVSTDSVDVVAGPFQRLKDFNLTTYNAFSRLVFSKDALAIVKDYPVFGAGGGGWAGLYKAHQSYNYWSTEVHNHFMQTWVEVGTLGFAIFLGIWVAVIAMVWRVRQGSLNSGDNRLLMLGLGAGVAVLALAVHSVIEFSLSLGAVIILAWALLGAIRAAVDLSPISQHHTTESHGGLLASIMARLETLLGGETRFSALRPRTIVSLQTVERYLAPLVLAALLILSSMIFVGHFYASAGDYAMYDGQYEQTIESYTKAMALDPWSAEYQMVMAGAYQELALREGDAEEKKLQIAAASEAYGKALQLAPFDFTVYTNSGYFILQHGSARNAIDLFRRALELAPHEGSVYENFSNAYLLVGRSLLEQDNWEDGDIFLKQTFIVYKSMLLQRDRQPELVPAQFRLPEMTPNLALVLGQAKAMLGDWEKAEEYLMIAKNGPASGAVARVWLGCIQAHQFRASTSQQNLSEAKKMDPSLNYGIKPVFDLLEKVKERYGLGT